MFYLLFILFRIFSVLFFTVAHHWTKFWTSLSKRFPEHFHELIMTLRKCISSSTVFTVPLQLLKSNSTCHHMAHSATLLTFLDSINLSIFVWVFSWLCCWEKLILVWKYGSYRTIYVVLHLLQSGSIILEYGSMIVDRVLLYNYCYLCYCYVVTFLACHCYFAVAALVLRVLLPEVPNRIHPVNCFWKYRLLFPLWDFKA